MKLRASFQSNHHSWLLVSASIDVSFSFSIMEALYARGFRTAKDITNLSSHRLPTGPDRHRGLRFCELRTAAAASRSISKRLRFSRSSTPPGSTDGSFQPINPDGSLVNCVPPRACRRLGRSPICKRC